MIAPVAGAALGCIFNLLGPSRDELNRQQIEQQEKLTNIQTGANEYLMEKSAAQQLDFWNKTNYEAQVEHIKAAGLNPALLYGKGGGGGATTGSASAGSVGMGQAASPAALQANKIAMGMNMAEMALMASQAEKTKAETENIKAQTSQAPPPPPPA